MKGQAYGYLKPSAVVESLCHYSHAMLRATNTDYAWSKIGKRGKFLATIFDLVLPFKDITTDILISGCTERYKFCKF